LPGATRILVVDDSATTRKILRKYLAELGYSHTEESSDGAMAWTRIVGTSPKFGLIIADWHMPNLSGLDLLKKIRATEETKELPVILVTAERNRDEVEKAIRSGVTGYIVKPFDPDTLAKALKEIGTKKMEETSQADEEQLRLDEEREKRRAEEKH